MNQQTARFSRLDLFKNKYSSFKSNRKVSMDKSNCSYGPIKSQVDPMDRSTTSHRSCKSQKEPTSPELV